MTPTSIITSHYVTHAFDSWMAGRICIINSIIQPPLRLPIERLIRFRVHISIVRQKILFTQFKWYSSLKNPAYRPCNRAQLFLFGSLLLCKFLRICFPRMIYIIDRPINFWLIVFLHANCIFLAAHLMPTQKKKIIIILTIMTITITIITTVIITMTCPKQRQWKNMHMFFHCLCLACICPSCQCYCTHSTSEQNLRKEKLIT